MIEKNKITLFLLILILFRAIIGFSQNTNNLLDTTLNLNKQQKQILILNSWGTGLPIPDGTKHGIQISLEDGGMSMNDVFFEDLDLVRSSSSELRLNLVSLLRHKLEHKQIGIVILIGSPAIEFLANEGKELFPDAALIALITPNVNSLNNDPRKIMYLPWRVDPEGSVKLALELFPNTKHVLVITGAKDGVLPFLDEAKEAFIPWENILDFEYTNEMTYEEMIQRVSSLTNESIILYSTFFTDKLNRSFVPAEVVTEVCNKSKIPVFATLEYYMGLGIVGGALLETESLGKQAGSIALDYLNGNIVLKEHVTSFDTPIHSMLDWQTLKRFPSSKENIPKDCIIVGKPLTLWEQYKLEVIIVISIFLILSALIITLLFWNRRIQKLKNAAIESEARFKVMIENAPEAVIVLDIESNKIVDANSKAEQFFGRSRQELFQDELNQFFHAVQPDKLNIKESMALYISMVLQGEEVIFERAIHSKDGRDLICEVRLVQLPNLNRQLLRGSFIDITERKQMELKLIKAKEKAEESEKAYKDVVETTSDLITVVDHHGEFIFVNHASIYFYGIPPEDCIGKFAFDFVHPDDIESTRNQFAKWLESAECNFYYENRLIQNNGKTLNLAWNIHIDRYENQIVKITSIARDITKQKEIKQELIKAKEKAEESDRLKSAFLANMSHEIRTPMNGILGFAGILKEPNLTGVDQQKYISIIEKSGRRMLNIINDIVDISKIEAGLITLDIKESNINEQIEYINTFFKPEAEAKGIKLSFKNTLPAKEAIIKTDREKVFAILTNLVKNAIKYTCEGSIEFGYNLAAMDYAPSLQFYVKDTGIGIPKDRQGAIFERFIQADIFDEMARQGAGLGLAITKAYTEILGGKIWVESEEGKGSTFYFTIPYNTLFKYEIASKNIGTTGVEPLKLNLKILIVEDDETSEMLLEIMVNSFGKEIIKARTGIEAIEACRNNPDIDLILMDIQMPEMNGYEATRQIRKFNKEVVIIAQTAFGLSGDKEKALEAGCNNYISKPIKKDELLALIQKHFKK